ncbi:hypothetical protein HYW35_02840 [Candidatus Saccharibacteria bacterium]|nr:hypothetical protein [Candidatus Saccharibacteria bacterium]
MKKPLRERSPLVYVLVGLIPYSKPNLLLAYKPSLFFRELEKASRYKQAALKGAYWRAQQQGLIKQKNNLVKLTEKGRRKIAPFVATELKGNVNLMVIFDIPEDRIDTRRTFRQVLKEWNFKQVQKSVWVTGKDLRDGVVEVVNEMGISDHVQVYESVRHYPK